MSGKLILATAATCLVAVIASTVQAQTDVEKDNMTNVQSAYIEVPDGKLYYEKVGQGTPMILLHDGLVHSTVWNHQWKSWADRFTLIRYDRRGFGKSPIPTKEFSSVDDLLAVYDSLEIDSAILIGMSAGARLAIDFAVEHHDRITHLVVVSPVVRGMSFTDHFLNRAGHLNPDIYTDLQKFLNYYLDDDPYEIYKGNPQVRAEAHELMKDYPNNLEQIFSRLEQPPQNPALGALGEIRVPTLIVTGEYDIADIHAHAGAISAGIEGAERVVLKDCGHRIPMEQPEMLSEAVLGFLSRVKFFDVLQDFGATEAANLYRMEQKLNPDVVMLSEARLNQLGYQYLIEGKMEDALELFKLNVDMNPQSANVYDSYGEALLAADDTTGAISNYEKSLELNPGNTNASTVLDQLRSKQ